MVQLRLSAFELNRVCTFFYFTVDSRGILYMKNRLKIHPWNMKKTWKYNMAVNLLQENFTCIFNHWLVYVNILYGIKDSNTHLYFLNSNRLSDSFKFYLYIIYVRFLKFMLCCVIILHKLILVWKYCTSNYMIYVKICTIVH